ncbi:MAG: 4Fe-4S dicluster domain-containing protein [Thermodesulfovibrionales bacterium]|nr:4Fe-4S dicluster domain-containing protein [Thermodesulfovibrionales bacterium]
MQNHFTRRDFLKASLITGSAAVIGSPFYLLERNAYAAKEEFEGPLPNIEVGGIIRPPGALPEKEFRAKCISCGVCVNVCHTMKYDAIAVAGIKDIRNFGTPYIKDMRDFPCELCMECPKHCPTDALKNLKKEKVTMGMALIDFGLCFGWNGDVCLSCSKACPMGANIFDFYNGEWGNQPYINENCVGCGLCVKYCPLGGSAIKVITERQYEKVKTPYVDEFKRLLAMSNEERYNIVYGQNLPQIMAKGRLVEREYR